MKIRHYLLASASTMALAGGAQAADLPLKQPQVFVPPAPPSWAGLYVGINAGVVTQQTNISDPHNWSDESYVGEVSTLKATGPAIGGQIGYNWQDESFVYGLEGDFDWVSAKASQNIINPCISCGPGGTAGVGINQSKLEWLSTIRGRAGIAIGATQSTLLYVTGGLAIAGLKNNWGLGYATTGAQAFNPNSFVSNQAKIGWTAGFGIEHMFAGAPHWSFRAEALWMQFENVTETNPGPSTFNLHAGPFNSTLQSEAVVGRVGVNYKF